MKRRCTPYAGIDDICPCLSLTVRHRWRIVNSLKALTGDTDAARRPRIDLQEHTAFFEVGVHNGVPCLLHECRIQSDRVTGAQLQMVLFIDESGQLVMESRYDVRMVDNRIPPRAEPILSCPHIELLCFIFRARRSEDCHTCGTRINRSFECCERKRAVVTVTRQLGKCGRLVDKTWFTQSREMHRERFYQIVW